jgi:hypothetical protein
MDVLSRSLASAAGLLLLLLLAAVVGEYESTEAAPDVALHRIHVLGIYYRVRRVDRDMMEGSGVETTRDTGESNVDWLGHHWYIFVVLLVIIIVVCVFVCACVMRRCRQGSSSYVNMQIHQNGSHHNSHISSSSTPAFTGRATQWAPYLSRDNSIHTENAFSSVTQHTEIRHTERSYTEVSKMTREGRSLSVIAPPTSPPPLGASDSPWAVIQSVAKKGTVYEGGKEGRGMSPGLEFNTANCRLHHHSHHHSHHRHHSHSHLHRGHHSHHKHFPKPLAMMNGIPSHVGASLHSFQSTSGSIQSDQSNHSSNQSNQSRSNLSSHSLSDNATVVEVSSDYMVHVRTIPLAVVSLALLCLVV